MKRENNKKFKKRKRNQNRSLTCRVLSMMFAIVLFCSTVLINTDYVSQASSFDDMVDMVEVEEDSAAVDTSEDTGDDLDTDVNFESESEEGSAETYSESDDFGSSDADFSSGENMFTDGTSESSAPAEEAAQPVSCIVNLKNETIEVKAEAPAGVLPNGTQMTVKAVENNTEDAELTDQYNKLAAKITEQLQSQGKNLDGFLAYNVSFTDADGNPVEPSDKVTYSFTYKEASSPELTDPAASTVTAAMIRTNKETSELELTELKAEEDKLTVETNESKQLTKAAFQSSATAAYTFVWSSAPAADDNENTENKEENGEVNNEGVNPDTNTENTEENGEETPDQEQTKMIRIIADEVNLRKAPSTDAEVIAAVDTDAQLPLLETVTGEDEFTWYKVSYNETEAYVRSDMAEVVETEEQGTENEDANEEEADVQVEDEVTYSRTIENVVVTATAAKGVLPDDAQFVVTPIEQGTDQYAETESKLNEKAGEDGYEIAGFLAYDIYFLNSEGNKIEPVDGSVNVSMHYTEPSVPEEVAQVTENGSEVAVFAEEDEFSQNETTATQMDITMMHLVEDENGNVNVVDMTQEGTASVETDAAGSVQKAEFETTSFSTFTITWKKNDTFGTNLIIKYVDEEGNEIDIPKDLFLNAKENQVVDLNSEEYVLSEEEQTNLGYTYISTKRDSLDGENVRYVRIKPLGENAEWTEERVPQVSADDENWIDVKKSSVIYMIYRKTSSSGTVSDLEVQRQKYIDKNDDGTYDITLNVSGSVETQITKAKVDVLMIADVSGSMNEKSRLENLKIAANALVDTFSEQKDTVDTQYSLVTFSNYGNKVAGWVDSEEFKRKINALTANGGTNYDQGLVTAKSCLSSARTQATKIVIFLTDGQPTFYGNSSNWVSYYREYYPYGRGSTTSERCITKALASASNISCDKFYGVGIGLLSKIEDDNYDVGRVYKYDDRKYGNSGNALYSSDYRFYNKSTYNIDGINLSTDNISGLDILKWVKNKVNASSAKEAVNISDNNLEDLTNKFKNIAYSATTFACSNVTIEDTLSDYVAPTIDANATENNSKLKIKVMKKENDQFTLIGEQDGDITNGVKLEVEGEELEAKYDSNNKKVNLNFPSDYTLKENYYYYVTITNLKPTNKAYEDYQKSGYNAAGDKLTDASEDKNSGVDGGSSSGQPGFYSNTEAKVTYTYNGQEKEVNYSKPVVQVVSSDLIKSKTAKVVDWDQRTYNITLNASSTVSKMVAANPVDVVLVVDRSASMYFRGDLELSQNCVISNKDSKNELKGNGPYYYITGDSQATVYRVWKDSDGWKSIDDSKWDYTSGKAKDTSKIFELGTKKSELKDGEKYQFYISNSSYDRFHYLKTAAKEFVTELKKQSSKSKVALVSFAETATIDANLTELDTGSNDLITIIEGLEGTSKTNQAAGLTEAYNILSADKNSGHKRYVVMLTDGCPNPGDYSDTEAAANRIKTATSNSNNENTTLMTIGLGLFDDNENLVNAKDSLKRCASKQEYYFDATNASSLTGIFESVLASITQKAPVTNVDVVDVIDSRFELTESEKKKYEKLQASGEVEMGTINGETYIKWLSQTIPAQGEGGVPGWTRTIQVKAKDSFIGGNNIPTNGAGSGVSVKGQLLEFEQPHVNVKVKMEVADKTVTIYKGDEMPTNAEILNQLFNMNNKTTSYSESIVDVSKVSVKWYTNQECTTPAKDENGNEITDLSQLSNADKHPTADKNYYIKVTYDAGVPSAESNQNTITTDGTIHYAGIQQQQGTSYIESAVNKENEDQKYGVYTVKVISGQIEITKKVDVAPTIDKEFYFVVTKDGKPYGDQLKVTVKAGSIVGEAVAKLENLERGTYVITETDAEGYVVGGTETAGTNCKVLTGDNKEITFKLGFKNDDKEEINVIKKERDSNGKIINCTYEEEPSGTLGKVEYTNSEIKANLDLKKIADTQDKTTYLKGAKFKLQKKNTTTGKWEDETSYVDIEVDNGTKVELNNLRNGDYSLTETKAPDGYSKLGSSIYFKVENGTVTLTGENGKPLGEGFELWQLDTRSTTPVLTIKNQKLYSLPESGGNGIYWYMIGGMVLMSTAAWILYKNKCREVLGK